MVWSTVMCLPASDSEPQQQGPEMSHIDYLSNCSIAYSPSSSTSKRNHQTTLSLIWTFNIVFTTETNFPIYFDPLRMGLSMTYF